MISTQQYENLEPAEQANVDDVVEGILEDAQNVLDLVAPRDADYYAHEFAEELPAPDPDEPDIEF